MSNLQWERGSSVAIPFPSNCFLKPRAPAFNSPNKRTATPVKRSLIASPVMSFCAQHARLVAQLRVQHAPHTTPLHCTDPLTLSVHAHHITAALRFAARTVQHTTGIAPEKLTACSLRPGGATALLCGKIDNDTIKLVGRWQSDAMLQYLHTQAVPAMGNLARAMFQYGNFTFQLDHWSRTRPLSLCTLWLRPSPSNTSNSLCYTAARIFPPVLPLHSSPPLACSLWEDLTTSHMVTGSGSALLNCLNIPLHPKLSRKSKTSRQGGFSHCSQRMEDWRRGRSRGLERTTSCQRYLRRRRLTRATCLPRQLKATHKKERNVVAFLGHRSHIHGLDSLKPRPARP
jgi:hypothetical protein